MTRYRRKKRDNYLDRHPLVKLDQDVSAKDDVEIVETAQVVQVAVFEAHQGANRFVDLVNLLPSCQSKRSSRDRPRR